MLALTYCIWESEERQSEILSRLTEKYASIFFLMLSVPAPSRQLSKNSTFNFFYSFGAIPKLRLGDRREPELG